MLGCIFHFCYLVLNMIVYGNWAQTGFHYDFSPVLMCETYLQKVLGIE